MTNSVERRSRDANRRQPHRGVRADSFYEHQRQFAGTGGAGPAAARLSPLSVDGLVLLAST
jgi:hypothetical protein